LALLADVALVGHDGASLRPLAAEWEVPTSPTSDGGLLDVIINAAPLRW